MRGGGGGGRGYKRQCNTNESFLFSTTRCYSPFTFFLPTTAGNRGSPGLKIEA